MFKYRDIDYDHYYHHHNNCSNNERSIEISLIERELKKYDHTKVVEVGNVVSHYFPNSVHKVIDKYERGNYRFLSNQDFMDYELADESDFFFSISTFEHIGYEEVPQDPSKGFKALEKVKSTLKKTPFLITMPTGWNKHMDEYLKNNLDMFVIHGMKKVSSDNGWIQVDPTEALNTPYDNPPWKQGCGLVILTNS